MDRNGFYFSLEAAVAFALIALLVLSPEQQVEGAEKKILLQQKMHDFLLVNAKQRNFSPQELKSDFEFVFPAKSGEIEINGQKIEIKTRQSQRNSKTTETINYIDDFLQLRQMKLTIFD